MGDPAHTKTIDWETNKLLIDAAKKHKIEKFILVTSMYITRPNAFISFFLNTLCGDCMKWKLLAENYLRKSGLDYVVIRPGGLKGEKYDTINPGAIEGQVPIVRQGDKGRGDIKRSSVGKFIVE